MICAPCKVQNHPDCLGTAWCECQHEPSAIQPSEPLLGWQNNLRGPF